LSFYFHGMLYIQELQDWFFLGDRKLEWVRVYECLLCHSTELCDIGVGGVPLLLRLFAD
jgi:hypothetical protein